ncbi:MAG: hypothetical protein GY839_10665 [candidate division Zixibacteria bacterium]|nr:hypothetical protein [candidate division Zixibacteria bacterium]
MLKKLLIIAIPVLLIGCMPSHKLALLDQKYPVVYEDLSLLIDNVAVIDDRPEISYRDIEIPTMSWPWTEDIVCPPLSKAQEELIINEVARHTTESGKKVNAVVYIVEGEKRFEGLIWGELEYVRVNLKINLYDSMHQPFYLSVSSDTFFEVKSFDASDDYIEQLYCKAIRYSIFQCFKQFKIAHNDQPPPADSDDSI